MDVVVPLRVTGKQWALGSALAEPYASSQNVKSVRFAPRKSMSKAYLLAMSMSGRAGANERTDTPFILLMPNIEAHKNTNRRQPSCGDGRAWIKIQLCSDGTQKDIRVEVTVRGVSIPAGLPTATPSCTSPSAKAQHQQSPMLLMCLGDGSGERATALVDVGDPLSLELDLSGCPGPGLIRVNVWSSGTSSGSGSSLLSSCRGLLLPPAQTTAAVEISRWA